MEVESTQAVEGRWVDRTVGLGERVDIAMVRTPEGRSRLELMKFHTPTASTAEPNAPANTLGLRRIRFVVDDIEDVVGRLRAHGAELVGEVAQYEDSYRLCYVRAPRASSSRWPGSSAEDYGWRLPPRQRQWSSRSRNPCGKPAMIPATATTRSSSLR